MSNYECTHVTRVLRTTHKITLYGTAGGLIETLRHVPPNLSFEVEEDDNGKAYLVFVEEREEKP